jgi:glycine C-acetyltransferase
MTGSRYLRLKHEFGAPAMSQTFYDRLTETLAEIEADGLYKRERTITSQQYSEIDVTGTDGASRHVLNFCANNYMGLANRPELIDAAKVALDRYGFGVASVRFICGAQEVHKQL